MPAPLADALVRHQVLVQRLTASEVVAFAPYLAQMDKEIRTQLAGDDVTQYNRTRLNALLTEIDGTLRSIQGRFWIDLSQHLVDFAQHEAGFSAQALERVIPGIDLARPSASLVRAAMFSEPLSVHGADGGKLLEPFVTDWSASVRSRFVGAIRKGAYQGQTNQQIVKVIRGTKALRYKDGIMDITARGARAIVHTSMQHVSSVARQETLKANADIVAGYKWLATLDNRTTAQCRALDGRVFEVGKGPMPPAHINCRSTTLPVLAKEYQFLSKGAVRPSVGENGAKQVPASETYYEWLMRQPASFQDTALGPMRGKLLREGGLSAERFAALQLDRNFQPLTLEQMKTLEPLAFARAGM